MGVKLLWQGQWLGHHVGKTRKTQIKQLKKMHESKSTTEKHSQKKKIFFYNAWVKVREYEGWKVNVNLSSGV